VGLACLTLPFYNQNNLVGADVCGASLILSEMTRHMLTFQRLFKRGHFRRHTSALKPFLTDKNKVLRVACALEEIDGAALGAVAADGVVTFKDMFDCVDVDEQWFY
jgi:hypothetical protein